jgi:hypothetical protein
MFYREERARTVRDYRVSDRSLIRWSYEFMTIQVLNNTMAWQKFSLTHEILNYLLQYTWSIESFFAR